MEIETPLYNPSNLLKCEREIEGRNMNFTYNRISQ